MSQKRLFRVLPVLLIIGFLLAGISPAEAGPPIRIMPLGDSITYDNHEGDTRPEGLRTGYRQPLWLKLTQEGGYNVDFVGSVEPDRMPCRHSIPTTRATGLAG